MRLAYLDRMSVSRILVSSGSEFESTVGYSRAVRVGPHVIVSGTTGPGPAGDIGAQTRDALRRIEVALGEAGDAARRGPHPHLCDRHFPLARGRSSAR